MAMGCRQEPPVQFTRVPQLTPPNQVQNHFGIGAAKNNIERGNVYAARQQAD